MSSLQVQNTRSPMTMVIKDSGLRAHFCYNGKNGVHDIQIYLFNGSRYGYVENRALILHDIYLFKDSMIVTLIIISDKCVTHKILTSKGGSLRYVHIYQNDIFLDNFKQDRTERYIKSGAEKKTVHDCYGIKRLQCSNQARLVINSLIKKTKKRFKACEDPKLKQYANNVLRYAEFTINKKLNIWDAPRIRFKKYKDTLR